MAPLKNPKHEAWCREVAGGLSYEQAWIAIGNDPAHRNMGRLARQEKIQARIAELRAEFNRASAIGLRYLQEKLISLATSDVTRFFEARPGGGLKLKDVTTLPPELRGALSEVVISDKGRIGVKLHSKLHAIDSLMKTIPGAIAPRSLDVTGMVQVEERSGDDISATDRMRRLNGLAWSELLALAGDGDVQRRAAEGLAAAARYVLDGAEGETSEEAKAEASLMGLCAALAAMPDDAPFAVFLGRLSELRCAIEERMEQGTVARSTPAATASESVLVDRMKTVLLAIVNVAKPFRGASVLAPVFAAQMRKIADALDSGEA
jgi:hypothetical protein